MDLEPFYAICTSTQEKDKRWAVAFCETLDGIFDDENFMSMSKVCQMFYGKSKGLSKAQYYRKRKYVIELYRWLFNGGYVSQHFLERVESLRIDDVVSEDELSHYYFKSIDSILAYITQVGNRHSMSCEEDLLPVKAIVILTWYQVSLAEMTLLKKSDLDIEAHTLHISGENKRAIYLDDKSFDIIKLFKDAVKYNSFPGGTHGVYQSSIYLFRSNRSARLNEDNLKCFCKRFNAEADAGQLISLLSIRKCGIFDAVMKNDQGSLSVNTIIQDIAQCDRQVAFGYAKLYARWKQNFYSDNVLINNK